MKILKSLWHDIQTVSYTHLAAVKSPGVARNAEDGHRSARSREHRVPSRLEAHASAARLQRSKILPPSGRKRLTQTVCRRRMPAERDRDDRRRTGKSHRCSAEAVEIDDAKKETGR